MNKLNIRPNIENADGFYAQLLALHEGKSKSQSDAINARLLLLFANHIGDKNILSSAMAIAANTKA